MSGVPRSRNMHCPRPARMHPVSVYLDIVFKSMFHLFKILYVYLDIVIYTDVS